MAPVQPDFGEPQTLRPFSSHIIVQKSQSLISASAQAFDDFSTPSKFRKTVVSPSRMPLQVLQAIGIENSETADQCRQAPRCDPFLSPMIFGMV